MKLSWRDLFSTLIVILVAVVLIAKLRSYDWAFLGSYKGAIGVMGVLGALMLISDEADFARFNNWGVLEGILALAGIGLVVAGLLVESKALFVILAIDILAFWLVSVSRHWLSIEPTLPHVATQ